MAAAAVAAAGLMVAADGGVAAAAPPTLDLKVLLIGNGPSDVTTAAWQSALDSEGVPYTLVTGSGTAPSETLTLPALSSGSTGLYNGVIIADDPADYASGQLSALDSYESSFGVRQLDGYAFPTPVLGLSEVTGGPLDGTTGTLTSAGLAALPELKGPVPFDTGSYGFGATVNSGAPFTPFMTDSAGHVLAGVYQHPGTDPQAGVSELELSFDYNASQFQWLLLAPGLINWVTQGAHLGLYRNYFGQDIDDLFIADNEWSGQFQCTPAATDPPDYTCPVADQAVQPGSGPGIPADVQMSAADVAYVVNWEQQTGIRLNLAFNAVGACSAPSAADASSANCTGSVTDNGATYTDPGVAIDASNPNDAGFVNALLADQADFNWMTHTWSHLFLGCQVWSPQALTSVTASPSGGTFTAGTYNYEITAATAYGESEPSTNVPADTATVGANGSVTLTWPEAANGTGTDGTPGPSLAQEEAIHTGGTGFWGYNIYRENPGSTTYGLVGQVAENPSATSSTTYSFTDTGTTPGAGPNSGPDFPTATNPGIDCSSAAGSWVPATSTSPDSSIDQEIGLDQAFAAANGLTNYSPAVVVTGEHSGIENPNMPSALAGVNVTTFAEDASRQPQQYSLGAALGAPRYPSNIYYNASNWPDELSEYNTLYVAQGDSLGSTQFPAETGHCTDTSATTCITTAATEATLLASESHIMLTHVLANNPRVGYAHQSNLIGPATQNGQDYGYTILDLISNMLSQYNTWYTSATPLDQMTDATEAQVLQEQGKWATAETAGNYTASEQNGTVTVANNGPAVNIPVTVPAGTTVNGTSFGQSYGGDLSDWVNLGTGGTETLTENVAPVITSAASASSIVGSPFSFTVTTTGAPAATLTESGALPSGITFTNNGNGTATIAGTAASGSGGSYPITITAANGVGTSATQSFTLTNSEAPTITSPSTASFSTGVAGTYTVTTTGYPAATITESGTLPSGLSFTAAGNGTATISGTPASGTAGTYPVTISATNSSGSTATLSLTITVTSASAPTITSASIADFTAGQAGAVAITTTGSPVPAITESGTLPAGLSFADNGNGTALISGTAATTGTTTITITASNGISPNATQSFTIVVGAAPAFTSANAATGIVGSSFSFTVTTSGYPAPGFGWSNVPPGLTFTDNGNGTATLAGTPTTGGTYAMELSAVNAYGTAQQTLTVTVQLKPSITSGPSAAFTTGTAGSFSVTTTGSPAPALAESGPLPSGVTFTDNKNGTATLAGTSASGTAGSYPITITASNGVGANATQSFTLAVNPPPQAPAVTSASSAAFTTGTAGSFSVTTTGSPAPALAESGPLPSGVTFTDNKNGTATLAGTSASGANGSYPITITASNGVGANATQSFTLTVNQPALAPSITSANSTTFAVTTAGSFTVTTTGSPTAALTATSSPALPSGVTFKDNGNGTAALAGTPPAGSQGVYTLTVTAKSTAGTATQSLALTVNSGLAITSASSATATSGKAFSFTVAAVGTPTPTLTEAGALPSGITFTANTNGTATLSGTAAASASGPYPITVTARNSTGTTSQAFTLTVANPPAFTSAASATETAGTAFSLTVATSGYPTAKLTSGTLPSGVKFSDNGNGTGLLSGTLAAGSYTVPLTATSVGGTATQTVTLTVSAAGKANPLPTFTSAAADTVSSGQVLTFTATTVGYPTTTYTTNVTESGKLPAGVFASNNGDGSNTITGTPTAASAGTYPITFTAKNPSGSVTQSFTLTVTGPAAITTAATATATVGSAFNFIVKATGAPAPALAESGALPAGLTWADNGNGTAILAGTPGVGAGGSYPLTLSAANSFGTSTQKFTLTVNQAPSITSAATATATHGKAFTFTFTSAGYPVASVTRTGTVAGLTYTSNSNGTATLSGTPTTAGTYALTITAKNSVGSATQTFTLTVS